VLKGQSVQSKGETRGALLRKGLTAFQFIIAEILIVATAVVGKQMHYALTADMGFKKDAIIYFNTNYNSDNTHRALLRDKLNAMPGIERVSLSNAPISLSGNIRGGLQEYKDGKKDILTQVKVILTDTSYLHVYHLTLLAGTNLPASDTVKSILINQAYANELGFTNPQDAIGKIIEWNDWGYKKVPVVGVVKDFHLRSFHEAVKPLVISSKRNQELLYSVALQPQTAGSTTWASTISKMEKAFKEIYPNDAFEYSFLDDSIAKYYTNEQSTSQLLAWATGLCVLISCLGLLGLAAYTIHQRTKEIGIRKVLGATAVQLTTLLSKDFLKPVLVAFVIAAPIAWYGTSQWLQGFAYKISLSWWVFLAGAAVAVVVALATIGFQTVRAALANPVKALKAE
jgi:ABC-type antimicrobial peptide transport system permease subunit